MQSLAESTAIINVTHHFLHLHPQLVLLTLTTLTPASSQRTPAPLRTATMPSSALLMPHRATNDEDGHDQIGSTSSTPPGATTPRPDPTDKRLPGILHSYFGQVRDSLMPRRKSSAVNPSPAPASSTAQDRPEPVQEEKESPPRPNMLPSPTPSASSRAPSTSQLTGESEKLTEGAFAPPQNQATPPQTPRTRSHESKPKPSSLSRTSNASDKAKDTKSTTPVVGPPKGKLAVTISEGRGLRPSVDPYVVCQFQWAEYISDGPRHDEASKGRPTAMQMKRTESEMGRPLAIPMKSRQSSNSGQSSDPRENGSFEEVADPKWEHEAILYVQHTCTN